MAADAEAFALSVKIRPEYVRLAKGQEGRIVQFHSYTLDRDVPAIVPAADSEAKRDGKDLLFPACSMSCGKALEAALHEDKSIAETFLK